MRKQVSKHRLAATTLSYLCLLWLSHLEIFPSLYAQVSVTGTNNPVVEKNNYIIRFSPNTGSYSLYKREVGKNRLVRLINDREPRSTYIAIALNGRVYTLGRSTRYLANKAERLTLLTDGGAMFWKLPQKINVKYYVRILSESSLTSYIRLNIIVENSASITQSVGLFHMFDIANNNLGLPAFSLPDGDVFRETILETSQVPYFVQTSYNAYFYLNVRGSTRPDRVILANWTKLHEAGWNYGFQLNSQGFGYNLYDSNNPALGLYYDARPLSARQSRSYVIYLAFDSVPSFTNLQEFHDPQVLNSAPIEAKPIQDKPVAEEPAPAPTQPEVPPAKESLTDELLRQLLVEQRRNNQLLEERRQASAARAKDQANQANPAAVPADQTVQAEPQSKTQDSDKSQAETLYLPSIDIEALNLLYRSESKRFFQLQALEDNLGVAQELQQSELRQLAPYRQLRSPEEELQAWRVQQIRLSGQLDNWNTYLVNIMAQLPKGLHQQPKS